MIHSLSGGVLSDGEFYTFAKVETEEGARWYLSPVSVKAGDRVLVPFAVAAEREGIVLRVENCTAHTAPCSIKHTLEILKVL